MSMASSSKDINGLAKPQVFINFRGKDVRYNFLPHLTGALERGGINVFTDNLMTAGKPMKDLYKEIEESKIAIAIISSRYTGSEWCLNELAKIKECVKNEQLVVIPVFYKVTVETVKYLTGEFGDIFRTFERNGHENAKIWKEALEFLNTNKSITVNEKSDEGEVLVKIEDAVKKNITEILTGKTDKRKLTNIELVNGEEGAKPDQTCYPTSSILPGLETRLEQLEEKLGFKSSTKKIDDAIRVVGVVGMPGIGKTTLAKKLMENWQHNFIYKMFLDDIREKSKSTCDERLKENLLSGLWSSNNYGKEESHQSSVALLHAKLTRRKMFIVLDDVSKKSQIENILCVRVQLGEWLGEGSIVVITASSMSVIEGTVDETYVVPPLNHEDALKQLEKYAGNIEGSFKKFASGFVDYSRGHPLALKLLGSELLHKDETYWKSKLEALPNSPSNAIQDVLRIPYDELNEQSKDFFLDLAYFFRFEDEYYVRDLLEDVSQIRDLVDKFLINVCGGRIDINDIVYTFAMGLDSQASSGNVRNRRSENANCSQNRRRLLNHLDIISALKNEGESTKVRGMFLDMSKVTRRMGLDTDTFENMNDLRYLKFFNSRCPRECEIDFKRSFPDGSKECKNECRLTFPEGVKFKLQEIRYFNWLKFPLEMFPQDFDPKNLIDLKLPYSRIEKVWEGEKDTSKLKWLDLNHSTRLHTLSGLSLARNLLTMNLEGCTGLQTLNKEVENMESLIFLNLRGCTSLRCFSDINLISLKKLILSGCSMLDKFDLIAEKLEELHLDGTAIKELPLSIGDLQKLILLDVKDCKELSKLPISLGNLKALQELILSRCLKLASFPEVKQNLRVLKTLLLDGTAITEMPDLLLCQTSSSPHFDLCVWPRGNYGVSLVQRLSLSRNGLTSLPSSIRNLYHLKWFDLKYCKNLTSLPLLPPNLQWFDAHGCDSLEKIDRMFAILLPATNHLHSTFIFTNCSKLDQDAKNSIISYAQRKIQLMSDALTRYDEVFVLNILIGVCFPGWQVPVWFNHRSVGSSLNSELSRHWSEELTGIALCAVVSFKNYKAQISCLLVRCSGKFMKQDKSCVSFNCILGGRTEPGNSTPLQIESGHVFIGYTSWLHVKKRDGASLDCNKICDVKKASLEFKVTDGTKEITNCEVIKCGFTLIYEPREDDHRLVRTILSYDRTPDASHCINAETSSSSRTDTRGGYFQRTERYEIITETEHKVTLSSKMDADTEGAHKLLKRVVSSKTTLGCINVKESSGSGTSFQGNNIHSKVNCEQLTHVSQVTPRLHTEDDRRLGTMAHKDTNGGISNQDVENVINNSDINGEGIHPDISTSDSTREGNNNIKCFSFLGTFINCLARQVRSILYNCRLTSN